jgi:hypothetical protein
MKNKGTLTLVIMTVVIIIGAGAYLLLAKSSYQWFSPAERAQYADVTWNKITSSNVADAFTPDLAVSANRTDDCIDWDDSDNYLKLEGGLCPLGYWLEIEEGSSIKKIDSLDELKETFAPVDSEAEASSFIRVLTRDLKYNDSVIDGYTATVSGGYLVQVIRENNFGCSKHQPTGEIYKVLESGEIELIAYEKPGLSFASFTCVD